MTDLQPSPSQPIPSPDTSTTFGTPAPGKTTNGLGIAALIIGIVAFILAFLPLIGAFGGFLAFVGLVLGAIGLFLKGKKKGAAIAGTAISGLALILSIVMGLVYTAAFVSAVDQSISNDPSVVTEGDAAAEEPVTDGAEISAGTRENPLPLGSTVAIGDDWEVTAVSSNLDATAAVKAASEFNSDPAPGNAYAQLDVHVKYTGTASARPFELTFTYVSPEGRSYDGAFVMMEGQLSEVDELFTGAEADGSVIIEIPVAGADQGVWGASSIFGDPIFFRTV